MTRLSLQAGEKHDGICFDSLKELHDGCFLLIIGSLIKSDEWWDGGLSASKHGADLIVRDLRVLQSFRRFKSGRQRQ